MAGASSDGEMNYWPGFVDALANLVLALVFVVVIFTLALAVISSKMAAEQAEREVERLRSKSVSERERELIEEVAQLQALLDEKEKLLNIRAHSVTALPPAAKTNIAEITGADLIFSYVQNAYDPEKEGLDKLNALMKSKGDNPANKMFRLTAFHSSGPYSQEKRVAFYRMVSLRNLLMERGVPLGNIVTKTNFDATLPGLQGELHLTIEPKSN